MSLRFFVWSGFGLPWVDSAHFLGLLLKAVPLHIRDQTVFFRTLLLF
jgi:hypothetical protein